MGATTRVLRILWRALGSTQLAAIMLAVLLVALALASLFPRLPVDLGARESWLAAATLRYGTLTSLLRTLGLFDAYRTPWFLALLAALLLNTLVCTMQRLPRLWQSLVKSAPIARPVAFYEGFAHHAEWPVSSLADGLAAAQAVLAAHRYRHRIEGDEEAACVSIHAERSRWAQASTAVSHIAALLLLSAVLLRPALAWQETGVTLLPGQSYSTGHGRDFSVKSGPILIERHANGQPRDLRVPLTVVADATPVVTRIVRINHPLTFHGVAFHLRDYGPAAQVTAPEGTFPVAFSGDQTQEITLPEAGLVLRTALQASQEDLFVEALTPDGVVLGSGRVSDGEQLTVQGVPVTFALSSYTVWQVSHDPTFGLAVGAAGLLLAGTLTSLWVPRRRLWLRIDARKAQMVGSGTFDGAFQTLAGEIAQACRPEGAVDG
jgi:cytochrome c biogenesis protein